MYLTENPVLQRELLSNLRMTRAFVLLFAYVAVLGLMVYLAWPQEERLDVSNPIASQRLVNMFFLGQYLLAALMAPSFTAGSITGEKERHTYEMLLASPLSPGAILVGKLGAALCHLALLIVASLPIVVLCLPLGGISLYEVLAAYFALLLSTITFGIISLACSSYFARTAAALTVSYLAILPLALLGLLFWNTLSGAGATLRLIGTFSVLPVLCVALTTPLLWLIWQRLLHPPDVGSEGKEVIDEQQEQQQAVGLVIRRGQFPDNLFAPAKRVDLLPDGANPVFDKEMRSEIFSQGTLMHRVVIQVSMLLAVPLMAFCLYFLPQHAPWYVSYVLLFNVLVGPVFSAGSVTGEREGETLDLLLTTMLSPWQILWAKLVAGMRVSSVLTLFLFWPLVLACVMVDHYWSNLGTMLCYLAIVACTCFTSAHVALAASVLFRKTSTALMTAYLLVLALYLAPIAGERFSRTFLADSAAAEVLSMATASSPFAAAFAAPLTLVGDDAESRPARWSVVVGYFSFSALLNASLAVALGWLFHRRWRVAQ